MSLFIFFSLSVRPDDPLKKWSQWFPSNKVKAMVLDREVATGETVPKNIIYSDAASESLKCLSISELEVRHHLRDGDVQFSHEKTKTREKPKKYYIEETINKKQYFVVVEINQTHSFITEFGGVNFSAECK